MSITIELPPDVESSFSLSAKEAGVPLERFLADWLAQHTPPAPHHLAGIEAERKLDEFIRSLPSDLPSFSDEDLRRENLYRDQDEQRV